MPASDFKASFMLDKSHLQDFIAYLSDSGTQLDTSSKYQLAKIRIGEGTILTYQSGIIIFEDVNEVRQVIEDYLESKNIENADFEKYQSVVDDFEDDEERGWHETPKGVWLNQGQIQALMSQLDDNFEKIEGEKHEIARYKKDKQTLVINTNGVVYTIGGFDNILQLLRKVITDNNPYKNYDRIVILDEEGRWERVGPICLTLVDLMMPETIELQLEGVKDDSLSRSTNHLEFMPSIEARTSYQTYLLTPEELNTEVETRDEYLSLLESRYQEFLKGQLLNLNENTLLIIDTQLKKFLSHGHSIEVSRDNRDTPAIGISSTITNASIQKWKEDWYNKLGFDVERHNLNKLTSHTHATKLVKQFLF